VFGLLPIGWTVLARHAPLQRDESKPGQFAVIAGPAGHLRRRPREAVANSLCLGAFMEGAAGASSPVALCGGLLVGLGVPPSARRHLLSPNTSPVATAGSRSPVIHTQPTAPASESTQQHHVRTPASVLSCLITALHGKDDGTGSKRCHLGGRCWSAAGSFAMFKFSSPRPTP